MKNSLLTGMVSFDDAGLSNTSRNVGKCGPYFYFVSSDQKLVQIDTDKVMANKGNPSAWESVVAGAWDGNVEDFVIRKSMNKDGKMEPRGKEVDIAILSKTKGTVYEVTYNGDTRSIVRTKEIKVEGSAELNNAVASVSYWNNIIEIELPGGTNSYIVNGYISNDNNNICISVGRNQFVKIPSSSKLVSYR